MHTYKKVLIVAVALVVLGVLYYGISPIFNNVRLDEVAPKESSSVTKGAAAVVDTPAHPASGSARIITTEEGNFLRYENFKTLNGPDLYVYLSNDLNANEFVNLGRLKATEGNVNYSVPANVNVAEYRYALVWCKAFGVLFNSADLSSIK